MASGTRTRPTSVSVDWTLLLDFNRPLGYVSASQSPRVSRSFDQSTTGNDADDMSTAANDKVVAILKNILSELDADIENERRCLKVM